MTHPMEPMVSTRPETTRRSSTTRDPAQNVIPLVACPTVGAKYRGGLHGISIKDGKRSVEQGNDGARAGLGNKHANTRDVPRFRALLGR